MPLFLALAIDNHPYALGRTAAEATKRAEARLRADRADMVAGALARGVIDDSEVDLSEIDQEPLPIRWPLSRVRAFLGAIMGEEAVDAELAALGRLDDEGGPGPLALGDDSGAMAVA